MSIYDNYEPTQEDIEVKERGGSNHHITMTKPKPKKKRWRGNNALEVALDNINSDIYRR